MLYIKHRWVLIGGREGIIEGRKSSWCVCENLIYNMMVEMERPDEMICTME